MNKHLRSSKRSFLSLQSFARSVALPSAIALAPASVLLAGGTGAVDNPYTETDVTNTLNAGTGASSPAYYLVESGDVTSVDLEGPLTIGSTGQYNILNITEGGSLNTVYVLVGQGGTEDPTYGGHNSVTITGSGVDDTSTTLFSSFGLNVGDMGSRNTFSVLSGADVTIAGYMTIGSGSSDDTARSINAENGYGYGNSMTISGAGSSLSAYSESGSEYMNLFLGYYGCANTLAVENGASANTGQLTIGFGDSGYGETGGYNSLTIGTGTIDTASMTVNGSTYVGMSGSNNALTVRSGASLSSVGAAFIGQGIAESELLFSTYADNGIGFGNAVIVTGEGSTWTVTGDGRNGIAVGYYGCGNTLYVTEGGLVGCTSLIIGEGSSEFGDGQTGALNSVVVGADATTGDSSHLVTSETLDVGVYGSGNSLTLQSGAIVDAVGVRIGIGYANGEVFSTNESDGLGYGNTVTVKGENSYLTSWADDSHTGNLGTFVVGLTGCGNSLVVEDNAYVDCGSMVVGDGFGLAFPSVGSHNSVTVGASGASGDGACITVSGNLTVGDCGSYNTVTVQSGAALNASGSAYIGRGNSDSSNASYGLGYGNTVIVKGADSSFRLDDSGTYQNLYVGYNGSANSLLISDGGRVYCGDAYIGGAVHSEDNIAVIAGSGSEWICTGVLSTGEYFSGAEGALIIDGGALVWADYVSRSSSASSDFNLSTGARNLLTTDTSLSSVSSNRIYLGSGSYIALSGDLTYDDASISSLFSMLYVYDADTSTWVQASYDNMQLQYIADYDAGLLYTDGVYSDLEDCTVFSQVPEPSTYALMGGAAALAVVFVRRRRK